MPRRGSVSGRAVRTRFSAPILLALVLLLPILAGTGLGSASTSRPTLAAASGSAASEVQVAADGHPTAGASSVSSAVVISLNKPVNVTFTYATATGTGLAASGISVGVARLQLIVFGVAAGVKELDLSNVHPSTSGTISVIGDYSYAQYLIEGVYLMHAFLFDPNGSTLYSESFYVKVHATYDLTVITVAFAVLLLYEVYTVATLGSARSVANLVKSAETVRKGGPGTSP